MVFKQEFRNYYKSSMGSIEKCLRADLEEIRKENPYNVVLVKDVKIVMCENEMINALAIFDIYS